MVAGAPVRAHPHSCGTQSIGHGPARPHSCGTRTISGARSHSWRQPKPMLCSAAFALAVGAQLSDAYTCEPGALGVNGCDRAVGPENQNELEYELWWNDLNAWADRRRLQLLEEQPEMGDFNAYDNPDVQWAQTAFVQPQAMIHDRFLYDRDTGEWTVDRFLDDFVDRYGGIDAVLLWQGYPNLGADDQNNFEMLRNLPGGVEGLRGMIDQFHERGVKVLWPNFVWDTQTKAEGRAQHEALAQLCVATGCDGINGDTMDGLNISFWNSGIAEGKGLVLEAQSMGSRNVPTGPRVRPKPLLSQKPFLNSRRV